MSLVMKEVFAGYDPEVDILQGVSLTAEQGKTTVIIGPNGAGKSTILNTICGLLVPRKGRIYLRGNDITGIKPHILARDYGVTYIAQERNIFPNLTVEENLKIYAFPFKKNSENVKKLIDKVYEVFPVLKNKRKDKALSLSGGQQRMLELSRVFLQKAELILVDEPTAGLAPKIAMEVYDALAKLKEEKFTILLVDQNVKQAVKLSDYVYMVRLGKVSAHGPSDVFEKKLTSLIHELI